jgi:predicted phage terminase large subunit-like protein
LADLINDVGSLNPGLLESSGWDDKAVQELLDRVEQIELPTDVDDVPEDVPAVSKLGDVWLLGKHRVMCGDSTDKNNVAKLMNGNTAQLLHADPPYGMGKENDGVLNDNLYLWAYYEVNYDFPTLVKYLETLVKSNSKRYRSSVCIIEPKASGISIIQQIQYNSTIQAIERKVPNESKISRVVAYTGTLEAGRVFLHEDHDWDNFLFQCSQFTREENYNDEAVDCLVIALQERERYTNNDDLRFDTT